MATRKHGYGAFFFKRDRIEKAQSLRSITQNQKMTIRGEAPALAGVSKVPFLLERVEIIDKAFLVLPGELKQFAVQQGEAFSKVFSRHCNLFEHFACF